MKKTIFLFVLIGVFEGYAHAQIKNTENTLKLSEGQSSEKATIADMAWLAGGWSGTGLGGVSEEIWSRPAGGTMMGTYRLIKADKPVFYEMLLLVESEGTLTLRLKHFHPNFVGWEEKDKSVDFKFVKKDGNRVYFSGLTFERAGKELNIHLALGQRDGTVREEIFKMKRVD
jgi:Domain of unknown function (DUF6265)